MTPNEPAAQLSAASGDFLVADGICKSFPGVKALDQVRFGLRAGEIHALMGENGAGKSTLIKVLTGVYPRDAGTVTLGGRPIHSQNTLEAQAAGISTVYQEVNLVPHLSVAENICLGRQPRRFGMLDWKGIRQRAAAALARLGIHVDVRQPLSSCSIAIQQLVAIARAVDTSAKVLILDEPTSSLDRDEVRQLFDVMRQLKHSGLGIIFVTHFLDQVYAVSDRITVLRNGQLAGTYPSENLPRLDLISAMLGRDARDIESGSRSSNARPADEVLVRARNLSRRHAIDHLEFVIRKGEVVGLAGLLGSGRTETARLLFGIDRPSNGTLEVDGQSRQRHSPRAAMNAGFGFCSEDRKAEGIIPNLSVRENLILALQALRGPFRPLPHSEQERLTGEYIQSLRIATSDSEKPIKFLSGGNQQKVLLARWLAARPRLLILDEPTRGVDVGAKFEILNLVRKLVDEGMSVLFISSELEELVRSCSRVIVLRDRSQVAQIDDVNEPAIMKAIAGADPAAQSSEPV